MSRSSLDAERVLIQEEIAGAGDKQLAGPRWRRMKSLNRRRDSVEQLALIMRELQSISSSSSSQQLTGLRDAISPAQRTEVIHKARDVLQRKLREEEPYTSLELVGMAALILLVILLPLACWFKFG
uniref:Uncharacterized protein n=1 Tax=Dunaliella tertiolecta TaxID=3047 RepID=A0A7S3QJV1_DUNTE|mmetsp:Transcript_6657/g.17817  ORF Transcript_6657/g.17817 Transcript_6657/m.17817 type:complete len:126 (-) Transcript_6657:973-1350(-)